MSFVVGAISVLLKSLVAPEVSGLGCLNLVVIAMLLQSGFGEWTEIGHGRNINKFMELSKWYHNLLLFSDPPSVYELEQSVLGTHISRKDDVRQAGPLGRLLIASTQWDARTRLS